MFVIYDWKRVEYLQYVQRRWRLRKPEHPDGGLRPVTECLVTYSILRSLKLKDITFSYLLYPT